MGAHIDGVNLILFISLLASLSTIYTLYTLYGIIIRNKLRIVGGQKIKPSSSEVVIALTIYNKSRYEGYQWLELRY